jgi:hypothetical protein
MQGTLRDMALNMVAILRDAILLPSKEFEEKYPKPTPEEQIEIDIFTERERNRVFEIWGAR